MAEKESVRKSFLKKRMSFIESHKSCLESIHLSLTQFLSKLLPSEKELICATYCPKDIEAKLMVSSLDSSIIWAYPRRKAQNLDFYIHSKLEKNKLGFKEPALHTGSLIDVKNCYLVVVPGIAFDKKGRRLGNGQGFYDRALEHYKGLKAGFCFSDQVSEEDLPFETHDVLMDYLVTENYLLKIEKENGREKRWIS